MKKNIIIASLAVLSAFATSSCEDKRADNLTPIKVYLPNSGVNNTILYNLGESVTYRLGIYKSGAMNGTAQVKTIVLSESDLKIYNSENSTNYQLIPTTCYSVTNQVLNFDSEDRTLFVDVLFNPSALVTLDGFKNGNYVLPVQIASATVDINEDKKISLLKPEVKEPLIYLKATGFSSNLIDDAGAESVEVEIPVAVDFENEWDLVCDFAIESALIETYNKEHGTAFELLPVDSYTFDKQVTIATGTQTVSANVKVERSKLTYGDYILPLQLRKVSKFGIDEKLAQNLVGVSYQANPINKATWTIVDFSSEEPGEGAPNGLASAILDGDPATFWHSQWAGTPAEPPHHVTIDMIEEVTVVQVDLSRRANSTDTKAGDFYISSDNKAWTKIGSFKMENTNDAQPFSCKKSTGRYLKVVVTESNRAPFCNLSEVVVRGM